LLSSWKREPSCASIFSPAILDGLCSSSGAERLALNLLLPCLGVLGVAALSFWTGRPIAPWTGLVGLLVGLLTAVAIGAGGSRRAAVEAAILWCVVAAIGWWVGRVTESSWDGMAYHLPAALALAGGWNPLGTPAPDLVIYARLYPEASWILGAAAHQAGLPIEAVRALPIAAIGVAAAVWLQIAWRRGWTARGAALLIALNPVCVRQALTLYVDGFLGTLITIAIGLVVLATQRPGRMAPVVAAASAIMVAVNLKFSGVAFMAIGPAALALFFARRLGPVPALMPSVALVIGTLLLGWAPYVGNWRQHGDPFFPGAAAIAGQVPPALAARSPAVKLVLSLTSESGDQYRAKFPWSVSRDEVAAAGFYDVRLAGFGPFFAAELLAALVALAAAARRFPVRQPLDAALAVAAIALFASVVLFPEPWWARFVPQVWSVPLIVAVLMSRSGWLPRGAAFLVVVLAACGCGAAIAGLPHRFAEAAVWDRLLEDLSGRRIALIPDPVWQAEQIFAATIEDRARRHGILVVTEDCSGLTVETFPGTYVRYCVLPELP
jgi:hypothetical protein